MAKSIAFLPRKVNGVMVRHYASMAALTRVLRQSITVCPNRQIGEVVDKQGVAILCRGNCKTPNVSHAKFAKCAKFRLLGLLCELSVLCVRQTSRFWRPSIPLCFLFFGAEHEIKAIVLVVADGHFVVRAWLHTATESRLGKWYNTRHLGKLQDETDRH